MTRTGAICISLLIAYFGNAQLLVDVTQTPEDLVQNVLLGAGVTVSNVTFNGLPGNINSNIQIGYFNATTANVGIGEGVLLCSGDANMAVGPNDDGGSTLPAGGILGPGDPDLELLLNNLFPSNDAAVLEFDFVPAGDSISFNFVFGSEEYLEFVFSAYNDMFGFFLSGPGISGPFSGGAENIALIPGTTQPVSIDNVNDVVNPAFYVDNGDGFTSPFNTDPTYIQFDGFTTVLAARALVQCGETYHIKIAVADAGDEILDSGVFLEGGSFASAGLVNVNVNTVSASGTMVEGCTDAELVISRGDTTGDLTVDLTLSGTATNGVDYTLIPSPIVIPAGSSSVSFPLSAFQDNISDGPEEIIFTTTYVNACGDTAFSTATVTILEYDPIVVTGTPDQFLDCSLDSIPLSASASGGFGNLVYSWSTGVGGTSIFVPGLENGSYTVTVEDDCNMAETLVINVNAGCTITIPNVFTPNGDGSNDAFVIEGILGTSNTVRIWNRWGNIVYETTDYRNNWRGNDLPDGTYFYEVIINGEDRAYIGHVTLLNN